MSQFVKTSYFSHAGTPSFKYKKNKYEKSHSFPNSNNNNNQKQWSVVAVSNLALVDLSFSLYFFSSERTPSIKVCCIPLIVDVQLHPSIFFLR